MHIYSVVSVTSNRITVYGSLFMMHVQPSDIHATSHTACRAYTYSTYSSLLSYVYITHITPMPPCACTLISHTYTSLIHYPNAILCTCIFTSS